MVNPTKTIITVLLTLLITIVLAVSGFGFSAIDKVEESKLDKDIYTEHKEQQIIQEKIDREKFDKIDTKLDKILEKI